MLHLCLNHRLAFWFTPEDHSIAVHDVRSRRTSKQSMSTLSGLGMSIPSQLCNQGFERHPSILIKSLNLIKFDRIYLAAFLNISSQLITSKQRKPFPEIHGVVPTAAIRHTKTRIHQLADFTSLANNGSERLLAPVTKSGKLFCKSEPLGGMVQQ